MTEIEKQDVDAEKVSSTVIRRLIERGEMNKAARMLSHPYLLAGDVDCAGHIARERLSSCFRLRVNIPCGSKVGPVCFG